MCGIFGVWNFESLTGAHLHRVSSLLRHRGPDDEGFAVVQNGVVRAFAGHSSSDATHAILPNDFSCSNALLHRRLSILDLSSAGHQPMKAEGRNIHIVFNGEIYNFRELIKTHNLSTTTLTDTEVVLQLYARLGTVCFSEFRGMWAMAILDLEKGELILSRDRFGIKPLYFSEVNRGLAFSSEIKPLLSLPGIDPTWSKTKLLQFLTFGATDNPHETFIDSVSALKPGYFRRWNLGSMQHEEFAFYNLRKPTQPHAGPKKSFQEVFDESIREHLIADVEVGSCLSGGLDSSAIVVRASQGSEVFKTFTCTFPDEAIDESSYARKVAEDNPKLEQHFTTPTAPDFISGFDALILLQERPIGSASIFAQYSVMQLAASKGMKVLLDGQGADEVLGGYYPFAGAYLLGLLKKGRLGQFRKDLSALKKNFNPAMGKAMLRAAFYALPGPLQVAARKRNRIGSKLISQACRKGASQLSSPRRGSSDFKELTLRSIEYGLYELLHYEDRNAMRFGIESRVPFLDHRLVEWALEQSPGTLMHNGWTKYPVRLELENAGLAKLAWRKDKLGFVAPQERWMKELQPQLVALLSETPVPDCIDRNALNKLLTSGLSQPEHLSEFWRVWSLLRWLHLFEVRISE